jgi:DNA-binding response OmpR family regulator
MPGKKKIVVADDEPIIISLLTELMSGTYDIHTAANGVQALNAVERTKPDMVILDVTMPEMDGFEACRCLKRNTATSKIPVIMLTARCRVMDIETGIKSGADAYIIKPFSPGMLIERVDKILSGSQV